MIHRYFYWDFIKVLCIIGVICIHTTGMATVGGVLFRQILIPSVAMFFFVAGYFCRIKTSVSDFYFGKLRRIVAPWAVWSAVYGALDLYFGMQCGREFSFISVISSFFSYSKGFGYFLIALMQCYLLFPILLKMKMRNRFIFAILLEIASVISLYVYYWIMHGVGIKSTVIPMLFCSAWLIFFVFGMNLRAGSVFITKNSVGKLVLYVVIAYVLTSVAAVVYYYIGVYKLGMEQVRLFSICFSFSVIVLGYKIFCVYGDAFNRFCSKYVFPRFIVTLGEFSMIVYLSHRFVIIFLRKFLRFDDELLRSFVMSVSVTLICFALTWFLKLIPFKSKLWWVGV